MKKLLSIFCILFCSGCATTRPIGFFPTKDEEYLLPKKELVKKYPEITVYEKTWRGPFTNYPPKQNIIKLLGEPTKTRLGWEYPLIMGGTLLVLHSSPIVWGIVIAIRPDIPQSYYYEKGNYCIVVSIDRTIASFYSQYMSSWKWMEDKQRCK
jgi:hypothetical protein